MISPSELQVRPLGERDRYAVESFLRTDPVGFIYPLGWLLRDGIVPRSRGASFAFSGAFHGGRLIGVTLRAGTVLLFVATHELPAARALMYGSSLRQGAFRVILGPRDAVDTAWSALADQGFEARLHRPQAVYSVDAHQLKRFRAPELRTAEMADVRALLTATIKMHEQEALERLKPNEIGSFRRGLEYQIRNRRVFVWLDPADQDVRFKASISASCDCGAQIEGVYVAPQHRRRGFATRALSELCQRLFQDIPMVSLYVNVDNLPAIRLYEQQLGFRHVMDYKTIFLFR